MKLDTLSPCASCPYRKDAPRGLWVAEEFVQLLMADENQFGGAAYGCHKFRNRPAAEQHYCAGWLLDQQKRGMPSIQLRIQLITNPDVAKLEQLNDGGHELYQSIKKMCAANGVTVTRSGLVKIRRLKSPLAKGRTA